VASDAIDYTAIFIFCVDFHDDLEMVLLEGEVLNHRGMM
jgi:hypothetical protein